MSVYGWGRSPLLQLLNRATDSETHAGHCTGPGIRNRRETDTQQSLLPLGRKDNGDFLLTEQLSVITPSEGKSEIRAA